MKQLILLVCALTFSSVIAQPSFQEKKEKLIEHLDERIKTLNEKKSCVSSAESEEALKNCHADMKTKRMEFREGKMKKRMERMQKRKKDE